MTVGGETGSRSGATGGLELDGKMSPHIEYFFCAKSDLAFKMDTNS